MEAAPSFDPLEAAPFRPLFAAIGQGLTGFWAWSADIVGKV